jgi:hypothetical protein
VQTLSGHLRLLRADVIFLALISLAYLASFSFLRL